MLDTIRELFKTRSLRRQLLLMLMVISAVTLLTTTAAFVAKETLRIVDEQRTELASLADILAKNTIAPLIFDDPQNAMETMATLQIRKNILGAYIIDDDGRIFARYTANTPSSSDLPFERPGVINAPEHTHSVLAALRHQNGGLLSHARYISWVRPIISEDHPIGTVVLFSDKKQFTREFTVTIMTALLVLAVVGTMAYLLSARLQRVVSDPILQLSNTMQQVTDNKDFSLRAQTSERNEIGQLYAGFNQMLREIEERDQILQQRQEHLQHLAHYDTLTGLPNRTLFYDRFTQALRYAQRHKKEVALYFVDLDHFKDINDSLGHRIGDLLLREVADRMNGIVRDSDTLARLGGDEFTIFAQNIVNRENAAVLARKLLEVLERPFMLEDHKVSIGASIGITLYPVDGETVDDLLINADVAMYHAKESGKNTFRYFDQEMNYQNNERLRLQADLRNALSLDQFVLHYQPRVNMATGRISGVEALIRWNHPEVGLVAPGRFIPLAEESGLIVPISDWVLQTACTQARSWQLQHGIDICMAVNLSAFHFKRHTVVDSVCRALQVSELPGKLLEVELTESLLMHNNLYTSEALNELKELGLTISIDDFGTGYSSLSYLQRFPIDNIKIDRSFILSMSYNDDDRAIVTAIIAMGKSLRMRIVAEGVETEDQYRFLMEQGCHEVQGYLLSQAVSADALSTLLTHPNLHAPA